MFSRLKQSLSSPTKTDKIEKTDKTEKDVYRRRHRLSKPLTNSSSANLYVLGAQQSEDQGKDGNNSTASDDKFNTWSIPLPEKEPRERMPLEQHNASPLSLHSIHSIADSPATLDEVWTGTTFVISQHEAAHLNVALSPSPSMRKAKRPMSAIFTAPFANSRKASDFAERRVSLQETNTQLSTKLSKDRLVTGLPCSTEDLSELVPHSLHRRSSFAPGVASRVTSLGPPPAEDVFEDSPIEEDTDVDHQGSYHDPAHHAESSSSHPRIPTFDEEWTSPGSPVVRAATPTDLDYTHLGGLGLGSLHVTNGRASPAPSEFLNIVSTPTSKRFVSNEHSYEDNSGLPSEGSALQISAVTQIQSFSDDDKDFTVELAAKHWGSSVLRSDGLDEPYSPTAVDQVNDTEDNWETFSSSSQGNEGIGAFTQCEDKTSAMAMEYMAEISGSPYSTGGSPSPPGTGLKCTSKRTEFEDCLFDNDIEELSSSEDADHLTPNTQYTSDDTTFIHEDRFRASASSSVTTSQRSSLKPANSTGSSGKPDSGYGSKTSLEPSIDLKPGAYGQRLAFAPTKKSSDAKVSNVDPSRQEVVQRLPGPRPFRPLSILKPSGSSMSVLPNFTNLNPSTSTSTLPVVQQSTSVVSEAPSKVRKLQKRRPLSQPPPVDRIMVQGNQHASQTDIPAIPAEILANLAIRSERVPELERTFKSMHHTRGSESGSLQDVICSPTQITFPDSETYIEDSRERTTTPFQRSPRQSLTGWQKSDRPASQSRSQSRRSSGISENDAMAIINDRTSMVSTLGGSSYDIASKTHPSLQQTFVTEVALETTQSSPHDLTGMPQRPRTPQSSRHSLTGTIQSPRTPQSRQYEPNSTPRRSKPMMDDATAAELARIRSRTLVEGEENNRWNSRRASFDGRGRPPARSTRSIGVSEEVPPLPPLPTLEQIAQREQWKADHQRPYLESPATERIIWPEPEPFWSDPHESPAPPPPSHSPQPQYVEEYREKYEEDYAPPPPSHSPRPMSFDVFEECEAPPPPSHSPRPRSIVLHEDDHAPPPPSHSPRPVDVEPQEADDVWAAQASAWKMRRQSIGQFLRSKSTPQPEEHDFQQYSWTEESAVDDSTYPDIPLRRPYAPYAEDSRQYQMPGAYPQSPYRGNKRRDTSHHSRPSYDSFVCEAGDRPKSRLSQAPGHAGSYVSLAESLYPPEQPHSHASPSFGRYSGGLDYGYEYGAGFNSSAGTRSVSGVAKATRKGMRLSENYGVDLSDVPAMSELVRRKPVGY